MTHTQAHSSLLGYVFKTDQKYIDLFKKEKEKKGLSHSYIHMKSWTIRGHTTEILCSTVNRDTKTRGIMAYVLLFLS